MDMKINKKNWLIAAAVSASVAGLAGCNSSNDIDEIFDEQVKLLIADDQGDNMGQISQYQFSHNDGLGDVEKVISAELAEGIAKDGAGNIYQAGNLTDGSGAIYAMCSPMMRTSPVSITDNRDRLVTSAMSSPKGMAIAEEAGYMIVAESGDDTNAVSVFGTSASNATTPIFTIPKAMVNDSTAWDVVYDEDNDRLFVALTNGDIAYFASYIARSKTADYSPTTIFRPDNALATSNMHGIVYDADADTLIVSDVADAAVADDGSIYVFTDASTLSGDVTPDRTIRGDNSNLGNPVDLQLNEGHLYVAEKANESGRILVFKDIASGASGDIAPDVDYLTSKPESIIVSDVAEMQDADISDLTDADIGSVHVTSNAGGLGTTIVTTDADLSALGDSFTPVLAGQFVESISLDSNGDAIVSFDDALSPTTGGLSFIGRLETRDDGTSYSGQRDRQISGTNADLVAPKGVEVVGSYGVTLVADFNAAEGAIKAYSLCGTGNTAPVFETVMPDGTLPWDLDYDPENDRLYVAVTNGTIQVYDDYMANPAAAPSRTIDPDDQSGFDASNIHGIVHDSATDRLIVSDVGSASVADDGRIYVIDNAASADGLTSLSLELAGNLTALGNPVDIAFDGTNLYVAEKSNNQLQRIDDIYSLSGVLNQAPDIMLPFTAPESVAIIAD
ncbi:hypothetical protein EOL70_04005 [Leucothrix sargassi]|nr:hypothetical protein EOL70_04005 [Leucothrix sargassi]